MQGGICVGTACTPHTLHIQKNVCAPKYMYIYAKTHTHTHRTHTLSFLLPRQWKYSIVALFYHTIRQLSRQKSKKPLTIVKMCDRIALRLYRVRGDIASFIQLVKSLREELVPLTQRLFLVHKGYFHRKASPLKRSFGQDSLKPYRSVSESLSTDTLLHSPSRRLYIVYK